MTFSRIYMVLGGLLVLIVLLLSDPDSGLIQNLPIGAGTVTTLIILLTSILYVGMLHLSRKALLDYINLKEFFQQALRTPEGSGLALIGIGLIMVAISIVIVAATSY